MVFQSVPVPVEDTVGSIYYQNFSHIASFFPGGHPFDEETFRKRKDYLLSKERKKVAGIADSIKGVRMKVSRILTDYNRSLGAGEASLANAALLGQSSTLALVTGQQAGLLTGPILTIYKTMTAILLARTYQKKLGIPVVPVFWIASEDHDFQEINHVHFLGEKLRQNTVYLSYRPYGRPAIQEIPTGEACSRFLRECLRQFRIGPYSKEMEGLLRSTLERTDNLADWLGALLMELFKDEGLVCLNPMLPELRELQKPIFHKAIQSGAKVNSLLEENRVALETCGLLAPVEKRRDHTHLFLLDAGQRFPLLFEGNGFITGEKRLSLQELENLIEKTPEKISPDVILRPITQEMLLPVLAYVAGPGEIDYWAQLPLIFSYFRMSMPPVYPRSSLTLIEPEMGQLLNRLDLEPEGVFRDLELELNNRLKEKDEVGLDHLFLEGRQALERSFDKLREGLGQTLGSSMSKASELSQIRTNKEWERLKARAWKEHRARHRDLVNDFQRISWELLPSRKMQETIYNLFSYYPVYGSKLLKSLMQDDLLSTSRHQFFFIGGK